MAYASPIGSGFDLSKALSGSPMLSGWQTPAPTPVTAPSPTTQSSGSQNGLLWNWIGQAPGAVWNWAKGFQSPATTAKQMGIDWVTGKPLPYTQLASPVLIPSVTNNSIATQNASQGSSTAQSQAASLPTVPVTSTGTALPSAQGQWQGGDILPAPGSPEYNQALAIRNAATSVANNNNSQYQSGYSVTPPSTIPSTVIGSGNTYADAINARNQLMQQASDILMNEYPAVYQNVMGQQIKAQFAGDTQDYGTGMANLVRMESTPVLQAEAMRAQAATQLLGNQQSFAQGLNPFNNQVSPGSTAFDPVTGQPVTTGMGASPEQIANTAMNLYQRDLSIGQPKLDQTGNIDLGYYSQMARQFIGASYGAYGAGTSGQAGVPSPYMGYGGTQSQGSGGVAQGQVNLQNLPPVIQNYVDTAPLGGTTLAYINDARVPDALKSTAQSMARQAGIPYLSDSDAQGVYAVQQILGANEMARALAVKELKSGVGGRVADTLTNWANNYLQFNPNLQSFNQLRDTAGKAVTALMGGSGSGFRMNLPEITIAVNNMPTASDNQETAIKKVDNLNSLLVNALSPRFPQLRGLGSFVNAPAGVGNSGNGNIDWANLQ